MEKRLLIFVVFVVASCGLAYELIASALSSFLVGDTILQFSTIIGVYLFSMGVGAALSKYVKDEDLITKFISIEIAVGILGGLCATALMIVFFYLPDSFKRFLYLYIFSIGFLVGMEIPLVMRILNDRKEEFKDMISKVLSFDYLGALFVSLAFPLICMPFLGITRTSVLFGMSNLFVALLSNVVFSKPKDKRKITVIISICGILLSGVFLYHEKISNFAEKGIYGNEIILSHQTKYQKLLITKRHDDVRLYINGNLQFSSRDEHRYHEALVFPAMTSQKNPRNVLVLGGGDGMAVREILKFPTVENVTLVDLDEVMTNQFKENNILKGLNNNSLSNEKVKIINGDAAKWLETSKEFYDVIIIDFPDPSNYSIGKLYSNSFFSLVKEHLSENGVGVIQSTSPYFAPNVYWTVFSTLKEVGFKVKPYHIYVPSFGDWGYFLISNKKLKLGNVENIEHKYMDTEAMENMFIFPSDMKPLELPPNKVTNQSIVELFNKDWEHIH